MKLTGELYVLDVDVSFLSNGTIVTNLRTMYSNSYKKNDKWINNKVYIGSVIYGEREKLDEIKNGTIIDITGSLEMSEWEKDGKKNYRYFIKINEFTIKRQTK